MAHGNHGRAVGFASRAVDEMQLAFRAVINQHYDKTYEALTNAVGEAPAGQRGQEIVAQWIVAAEAYAAMQESLSVIKRQLVEYGNATGWLGVGEVHRRNGEDK